MNLLKRKQTTDKAVKLPTGTAVTPFMTNSRYVINGKIEYVDYSIDWNKVAKGMGNYE